MGARGRRVVCEACFDKLRLAEASEEAMPMKVVEVGGRL
jgi:hypothetical protein